MSLAADAVEKSDADRHDFHDFYMGQKCNLDILLSINS